MEPTLRVHAPGRKSVGASNPGVQGSFLVVPTFKENYEMDLFPNDMREHFDHPGKASSSPCKS